jgi:3-oxoacyl-[acyl-carrier-protein] synthase II
VRRRVVVTGLGAVSCLGVGTDANWNALVEGKSGIGLITRFDTTNFPTKIAGEVKNFDPTAFIDPKEIKKMDLFIQYALTAADLALKDAGLPTDRALGDNAGVYIGSGIGGFTYIENNHTALVQGGPRKVSPFFIPGCIINLASGFVSIRYGAKGPNSATATACSASSHAIGDSYRIILIAGGAEGVITPLGVGGFCAMKALSTRNDEPQKASRPFDLRRDGFVMGEGSGILILEELTKALDRGARIYAEIIGYGMSADAYHITAPSEDADGAVRVMRACLRNAGVEPETIDYINAHGTSTTYNDKLETLAIKKVFGEHAYKLNISSSKSMTGHMLGASGGIEAVISVLTIVHKTITPTINLENPDPECDLNYTPNVAVKREVNYALSNSFGFGGTNASLLFKKYER